MFSEEINKVCNSAVAKSNLLKRSRARYFVASMMAGIYVGFGILLIFVIGGTLNAANSPMTKILMGMSFGIALSLVVMAGSELFTGNNMIMTIGALEKRISMKEVGGVWLYSYFGNLFGGILISIAFVLSGLANKNIGDFIIKTASAKITTDFTQLFFRGILCNMLVCLAVWCSIKLKEETAKLIMIFWCLFAFITTGFEHSVANMTLLTTTLMLPGKLATVTLGGYAYNLIVVTLGNIVGGALFIGVPYWFISREK